MTTVDDLLRRAVRRLQALHNCASPGREARFLLARTLDRGESWVLAHGDEAVDPEDEARFLAWIGRRAGGEPAHYIVGRCPFWGRSFVVSPAVLLPRPETELLIEAALNLDTPSSARTVDVGTGSGCLAVTLSLERPGSRVAATDRSSEAVVLARRNARLLGAKVAFAVGDVTAHLEGGWELLVANLPYVPSGEIPTLQAEVRMFEPHMALDGGADGLAVVLALADDLPRLLAPGGFALLELGPEQATLVGRRAGALGLEEVARVVDPGGVERVLVLRRPRR